MFQHGFLATIEAVRESMDGAMLDGHFGDERLESDLMGGDLTWESSYALPGERRPPNVRAELTLDWPTWSQSAVRSWQIDGNLDELPEVLIEVVLRVGELAGRPDIDAVRRVLDTEGPDLGTGESFRLAAPLLEQSFDYDLDTTGWALEFTYEGSYELTESVIADVSLIEQAFEPIGPWVASMLVRLGDLRLEFTRRGDERS